VRNLWFGASLSRIDLILTPIKRLSAERMACVHRRFRQRLHTGARKRTQSQKGSVVDDGEAGFHDEAFDLDAARLSCYGNNERTVNSLY